MLGDHRLDGTCGAHVIGALPKNVQRHLGPSVTGSSKPFRMFTLFTLRPKNEYSGSASLSRELFLIGGKGPKKNSRHQNSHTDVP